MKRTYFICILLFISLVPLLVYSQVPSAVADPRRNPFPQPRPPRNDPNQNTPSTYMIFASDTQYPRALDDNGSENSNLPDRSGTNNNNHVASMNKLISKYGSNFKGVVINGDLTEYGHNDKGGGKQLDEFVSTYENGLSTKDFFFGLGNHDYANNVDNCAQNGCANQMIDYLQSRVKNISNSCPGAKLISFDYKETDGYKAPAIETTYAGSLAYSWEMDNFHFVQLNNYPTYTRNWSNYRVESAKRKTYNIVSSLDWLKNDLATARNAGKVIIINFHDPYEHWADYGANRARDTTYFTKICTDYGVSAVFVGHFHQYVGHTTNLYGNIPTFYCGSSIYKQYLLAEFNRDTMRIRTVSSEGGDTAMTSDNQIYILNNTKPTTPLPVPTLPGYVVLFNQGGYVAKFSVSWLIDGKRTTVETGNMSLGEKRYISIPGGVTNVGMSAFDRTGLVWNPWKNIFSLSYPTPPNQCFKVYGTTLYPNWNNNCD